jgi:hypothetical protein
MALHVKLEFMNLGTGLAFDIFNWERGGGVHESCNNFFPKLCTMIFFHPLNCSTFGLILFCLYMYNTNNIE